jgi:hypothetical protein
LISFSCDTEDFKLFKLFNVRIKRRVGSIKGVRNLVLKLVDFERVNEWIVVCIIYYNIFVTIDDAAWEEEDEEITNVELGEVAATDEAIKLKSMIISCYNTSSLRLLGDPVLSTSTHTITAVIYSCSDP